MGGIETARAACEAMNKAEAELKVWFHCGTTFAVLTQSADFAIIYDHSQTKWRLEVDGGPIEDEENDSD